MSLKTLNNIIGKRIDLKMTKLIPAQPEKGFVDSCCYDIYLHNTSKQIGSCSAKLGLNDVLFYIGNVGYEINEEYRGNGFAVDAVKLLIKLFKLNGFKKIIITQVPTNVASIRVCEKLNCTFLGVYDIPADHIRRTKFGEEKMNVWELAI